MGDRKRTCGGGWGRLNDRVFRWALLGVAVSVGVGVFARTSGDAVAQPGAAASTSTRIGIVDVVRLVNELDSFKAGQREVDELAAALTSEVDAARSKVQESQDALEMAVDANRERLVNEALASGIDFRGALANRDMRVRLKQNQILRSTWASVRAGIREYAEQAGYDVVLADDSMVEPGIPLDADPEAFKSFMTERRVLHAGARVNITDEVVTRLNNDFRAEQNRRSGGR